MITSGARLEKAVLWICEEHNYLPFCTDWSFVFCYIWSLLFQNIPCIIPPNLCLSPVAICTPKFESDLVRNSEERPSRDVVCHMKKWVMQSPRKFWKYVLLVTSGTTFYTLFLIQKASNFNSSSMWPTLPSRINQHNLEPPALRYS